MILWVAVSVIVAIPLVTAIALMVRDARVALRPDGEELLVACLPSVPVEAPLPIDRATMADFMNRLSFVQWDRMSEGAAGRQMQSEVFGWIDRDDGRSDFVALRFSGSARDEVPGWVNLGVFTSSALYSEEITRIVLGEDVPHYSCLRVEDEFGGLVEKCGEVVSQFRATGGIAFIYELMRDHVPVGTLTELINDLAVTSSDELYVLSDHLLAAKAVELNARLHGVGRERASELALTALHHALQPDVEP